MPTNVIVHECPLDALKGFIFSKRLRQKLNMGTFV